MSKGTTTDKTTGWYYESLMRRIDQTSEIISDITLTREEALNSLFNYFKEMPNRILNDHGIPTDVNKNEVITATLNAFLRTIEEEKIRENSPNPGKSIIFQGIADRLERGIQENALEEIWNGFTEQANAIVKAGKALSGNDQEPSLNLSDTTSLDPYLISEEDELALDQVFFHDTEAEAVLKKEDLHLDSIDPIIAAIRKEIIEEQRNIITQYLIDNQLAKEEQVSDPEKFRKYCADEEHQEHIKEAHNNPRTKALLEQAEIKGYQTVHSQFSGRFSTMNWSDGAGKNNRTGVTTKTQIVRNSNGDEIAKLTESTHKLTPPQMVQKSDGTSVEIRSYRTIDFPRSLEGGTGPMHLSLAVKDQNGNNIAANRAVYFTAHYDDNEELVEVSSPKPVKFNSDEPDAIGYIEHGGQIYTLPVTRAKYQEMMQEVARNNGHDVDISQTIDNNAVDLIETSVQKSERMSQQHINSYDETNLYEAPPISIDPPVTCVATLISELPLETAEVINSTIPIPPFAPSSSPPPLPTSPKPGRKTSSEEFDKELQARVNSLKETLSNTLPAARKPDIDIDKSAEKLYATLQKTDHTQYGTVIDQNLGELKCATKEKKQVLEKILLIDTDKRAETLGRAKEGGTEKVATVNRLNRSASFVNTEHNVKLQAAVSDRLDKLKPAPQNRPVTTFIKKPQGRPF